MALNKKLDLTDLDFVKKNILCYYDIDVLDLILIKIKNTKKQRAIYKVITPHTAYCLKKVYYPKAELEFVLALMKHLDDHGFNLPEIIHTKTLKSYVDFDNSLFFLSTWINGQRCDYDKVHDLKLISQNLALFHNGALDFNFIPKTKNRYNHSNWLVDFNQKSIRLSKIYEYLSNDLRFSTANNEFFMVYAKQYHIINKSLNLLMEVDFHQLIKQAIIQHHFCHLDYVNKNLYIDKDIVYLIDFDRAKLDMAIHDLASLIRRVMRRKNIQWSFATAQLIIDSYHDIRNLNADELKAILAYVIFPQKFYTETKRYLRDMDHDIYFAERFRKIYQQYQNVEDFIVKFENHYIK